MSFYVCAGLYAEGPSDYGFLLPLINRVLGELLAAHFPAQYDFAETLALTDFKVAGRDRRIAIAIAEQWTTFTLFVVHSDGDADPRAAHATFIAPAIKLAKEQHEAANRRDPLIIVPCIPVHELEAWLLTDAAVFRALGLRDFNLPAQPERITDPKATFNALIKQLGYSRPPFDFFGERINLDSLRKLEAFRDFEAALLAALHLLARPGGRP